MGEAKNPGPPNNHFWSCAPEARQKRVQWKGGERRPRAPQPNAGEQVAKGNSPGPNPHGDHLGQASGGSALGINQNPAAMIHNRSSRPGSAQGKNQPHMKYGDPDAGWASVQGGGSAMHEELNRIQSEIAALTKG